MGRAPENTRPFFAINSSFNQFIDQPYNLTLLSMTFGREFGIEELPVHAHLEAPTVRRDKCHCFDQVLELLEQVICQANGPVGIMSDCAINDLNFEHKPSQNGDS